MRWRLPLGLATLLVLGVVVATVLASGGSGSDRADPGETRSAQTRTATAPRIPHGALVARISPRAVGRPIRAGFLGFSFEFQAVRAYTGSNPSRINPVLEQLIRNVAPGQAPVIRIGGDSTDVSYAPSSGVRPPPYEGYPLTPSWMATTGALAHELGARIIAGLNLAADDPSLAAAEARQYSAAFGRRALEALEIGNEPNVYANVTVFHTASGARIHARPPDYGYSQFAGEFAAIAAATPSPALAGPALAVGPTTSPDSWITTMPAFLDHNRRIRLMTVHRYPLRNCFVAPSSPQYPTISHLLASYATVGLAGSLRPWIAAAHAGHRQIRVDELNSVACRGKKGISDTFASSLWVTDALFALARAGVDGVNLHTLPKSSYELFQFSRSNGRWRAWVRPVYYGLQLFGQAAPPGSRLLKLHGIRTGSHVSVWATRAPDGRIRVALINKSPSRDRTIAVRLPRGTGDTATIERMQAPSVHSKRGVTLGGRTYGRNTYTGALAPLQTQPATGAARTYVVKLPRGSAALLSSGG
ncbi:MAG TPA: glycosyl hydrolase family 79 C-terminal domain-containing protein [Solirubrobacteraceae bacterium]